MKIKILFTTILILSIAVRSNGQNLVINGDFEDNAATRDMINCTTPKFDSLMSNVHSFGTVPNPDIIESDNFCNWPEHDKWNVALTGGGTDAITLKLSSKIKAGNIYALSFWDEGCGIFSVYGFKVGISTNDSTFGTEVYQAPNSTKGTWINRLDTFTAPVSGLYITIEGWNGDIGCWNELDNMSLVDMTALTSSIKMPAAVCANQPASIAYNGNGDSTDTYTWNFNNGTILSGSGIGPYQVAWATAGAYYVSVKVTDSTGDTASSIDTVTVNAPPTATYALDTVIAAGETDLINYTGNGSASSSFNWSFNNALVETNNGDTSYNMTWAIPGVYTITLAVTQNGCTSLPINKTVYVGNPITVATPVCTDSISMVSYLGFVNDTANYNWNFSGANIIAGRGAGPYTLQYGMPGSYPVSLSVTINNVNYSYTDTIVVSSSGECFTGIKDSTTRTLKNNDSSTISSDSSKTTGINIASKKIIIDNIYPNPTLGNINVDFQTSVPGSVHFEVYDVLGRLIISNYNNGNESVTTTILNTSELPAGSYFIRITEDNFNFSDTQKFIKLL